MNVDAVVGVLLQTLTSLRVEQAALPVTQVADNRVLSDTVKPTTP